MIPPRRIPGGPEAGEAGAAARPAWLPEMHGPGNWPARGADPRHQQARSGRLKHGRYARQLDGPSPIAANCATKAALVDLERDLDARREGAS